MICTEWQKRRIAELERENEKLRDRVLRLETALYEKDRQDNRPTYPVVVKHR